MGKTAGNRDWAQIYAIYGIEQWQTLVFLLFHAFVFSLLSVLFLIYFDQICFFLDSFFLSGAARLAAGFTGAVTALSAVCLLFAAANFLYSDVPLQYKMAQRMVSSVGDWSCVKTALDLGCGRGILLNAVATQLKKTGSSGRVVGLDRSKRTTLSTLRTAKLEGVQEYVTCREGDVRTLPFGDNYFDVVVSSVFVHTVGKEHGQKSVEAAAERMRVLGEIVRVVKPGGLCVVWDLLHVPEYVRRLQELKMEDIRVSERVTAFMAASHIVSFRKPSELVAGPREENIRPFICHFLGSLEDISYLLRIHQKKALCYGLSSSGLPFLPPRQYLNYPSRLAGRGTVEITIEKSDGSTFQAEAEVTNGAYDRAKLNTSLLGVGRKFNHRRFIRRIGGVKALRNTSLLPSLGTINPCLTHLDEPGRPEHVQACRTLRAEP
ncbi:BnaCnng30330D [Brassica napus]|uniref:(rape) hypothetical protein n=1 Tax=Brassica napus TaxID=3708 RepID=A0A078J0H4_BRANA|nr:unnamed protein product [Brassica napus]CDY56424.1 BnaCnng30330D [Brassica napus]